MSIDYSIVQKDICDIKKGEEEATETQEEFCPTCLINPHAAAPSDWWNQVEPYLNQKTCEYYIPVNINAQGRTYTTRELKQIDLPFNVFKYSYLRTGIRKGLRHFNRLESDRIVCAKSPPFTIPGTIGAACPHLYNDLDLQPFLGRFYIEKSHKTKDGHDFKTQEVNENLANQFDQITNLHALELFAKVEDYHLGNGHQPIKVLVTIPAFIFDQIPLSPFAASEAAEEEETEEEKEVDLKESVELSGYDFKKNLETISAAFDMWTRYQAMFFNLQGGRITILSLMDEEKEINFYIKKYKKPLDIFGEKIERLLVQNDFLLTENKKKNLAAEKIKITFKKPTETKQYRITKVEAKYKNCEYQELSSNFDTFLSAPQVKEPTILNYIANMEESAFAAEMMKSAPWVDWIQAYTYPKTKVNYAFASMEDVLGCIENPAESSEEDDALFNVDFSFADALAWFTSQLNCKNLKDMQNYDPIKELDKLKGKFGKLINANIWADNNAIRELFGLPIDFAAVATSGDPLKKISEFFNRLTLCNISVMLFEILKCLFGTFSLEEMIEVVVTRILMLAGIPAFKLIYEKSPQSVQERTRERAVSQLAGFDKSPWEYYEEKLAEKKDLPKYMVWLAGVNERAEGLGKRRGLGGGENPPEKNIEEVFNEWVKQYMLAIEDIEWILDQIKDFPGAAILKLLVATFACPNQHVLKKFFAELKGIINFGALNPCNPLGEKFLELPTIPKIPKMAWKEILRSLLMILIKKLIDIIANLLLSFLLKFLVMLNCDTFKGILDFLANGNEKALEEAIGESFCDDADALDNSNAMDTMLGLMDEQGLGSNPDDLLPLAADLSALVGKNEFKKAFLNTPQEQDPDFCLMMCSMVNDRHPKFAGLLGTPENVGFFFSGVGNFLSPRQKELVAATIQEVEIDTPIEPSICLTNEQLVKWNEDKKNYINALCGNMPMEGYRPGEGPAGDEEPSLGDDWLDKTNDRKKSNLDEVLDMFINGPAGGLGEALEEAMKVTAPSCNYDPETGEPLDSDEGEGASNSAVPAMPEEITSMIDNAKKDMYTTVDMAFVEDMTAGYDAYFNNLFSDTYNFPFYQGRPWRPSHQFAVNADWFFPNAAHNEAQWQAKWDSVKNEPISLKKMVMKTFAPDMMPNPDTEASEAYIEIEDHETEVFNTHAYPETIGLWMYNQMISEAEELEYSTDIGLARSPQQMSLTREYQKRAWKKYKRMDSKDVVYKFKRTAVPNTQMKVQFRDNNSGMGGWKYGFNLRYLYNHDKEGVQTRDLSYRIILDELDSTNVADGSSWKTRLSGSEFEPPSTIKFSRDRYMNVEVPIDMGNAAEVYPLYSDITDSELTKYNAAGVVFKNYINNLYSSVGAPDVLDNSKIAKTMFDEINSYLFSEVISKSLYDPRETDGLPQSFMFGYVNDVITKEDLTYISDVGEDGEPNDYDKEDPDTWGYEHDNDMKILGKSATGHPRVEFLDPEEHGVGKYTKPKIYIHEPSYTGWLGLSQMIVPEEDHHEPKRKAFIFIDDIVEAEKDLREEIPYDERLNDEKECLQERTYDILNEPSGHAGLHSTVLMTTRAFAFEHILKSLSIYSIIKIDFKKNFEQSVLASIVKDMEEELSDIPSRGTRGGYYKKYNYWLLFLEQSVQTFERLILTDQLEVTDSIADLIAELQEIREASPVFTAKDKRWMKFVKEVTWDSDGQISHINYAWTRRTKRSKELSSLDTHPGDAQHNRIVRYMDAIMFNVFGKSFRSILANETREFSFRMRKRQTRGIKMCNKLYNIHLTRNLAKSCLQYVVANQIEYYADKLRSIADDEEAAYKFKPRPLVDDLRSFVFGSSGTILAPLTAGTSEQALEHIEKLAEDPEAIYDYGSDAVKHVVHSPLQGNPLQNFTQTEKQKLLDESPYGNFYFEKYLRIIDRTHLSGKKLTLREELVRDRVPLLKNVVNIKEFQTWISENLPTLSNPHWKHNDVPHEEETEDHEIRISDLFGNAAPVYGELSPEDINAAAGTGEEPEPPLEGYDGSIGIKFGVRLCFVPKSNHDPEIPNSVAIEEKSFLFRNETHIDEETEEQVDSFPSHNIKKIFPIVSYERDIVDKGITELNLIDDNFGEDLDCYIEELLNSPDMSLLFDYCFPLRRAASLMSVYSNYAFVPSVGEDPTERNIMNGSSPIENWKGKILKKTKRMLRKLFVANYRAIQWYSLKEDSARDKWKFDFKIHFSVNKPDWGWRWAGWRIGRRLVDRPYDMYGNLEDDDAT